MKKEYRQIWELAKPLLKKGVRKDFILHTKGVIKAMELIMQREGGDEDILLPAAILHDIGWSKVPLEVQNDFRYEDGQEVGERMHIEELSELAESVLKICGYPAEKSKRIIAISQDHKKKPDIKEAKLLIDADNLSDAFRKQFYSDSVYYSSTPEEHYYYRKEHSFFYTKIARNIFNTEMEKRVYEFKKDVVMHEILMKKPMKEYRKKYSRYSYKDFVRYRIPEVTIHGRWQPPLHFNHFYAYVATAFRVAHKVRILIVEPTVDDKDELIAQHRQTPENNPFSYEERVCIFKEVLNNFCIPAERYEFFPFNLGDSGSWNKALDKKIPNLINTYSAWGGKKLVRFQAAGYMVIHSSIPRLVPVSGSAIRDIINSNLPPAKKKEQLINSGYMEEAIPALFEVLDKR